MGHPNIPSNFLQSVSAEVLVCVRIFLKMTNIFNACAATHVQQHGRRGKGRAMAPLEFSHTSLKPPEFQKFFHF